MDQEQKNKALDSAVPEIVNLQSIEVQRFGTSDPTREGTWRQRQSIRLARWILVGVIIFVILDVIYLKCSTVSLKQIQEMMAQKDTNVDFQKAVEIYKTVSDATFDRFEKIMQYLVGTVALPLVTLLLGHAFGKEDAENGKDS